MSLHLQLEALPNIVNQFISQVKGLYVRGARTFWIHNTGPIGCLPAATTKVKDPAPGYLDEIGCVKYQNEICNQFNKQLKDEIMKLRAELADAAIVYVDMYAAKYNLISQVNNQGDYQYFSNPSHLQRGLKGGMLQDLGSLSMYAAGIMGSGTMFGAGTEETSMEGKYTQILVGMFRRL